MGSQEMRALQGAIDLRDRENAQLKVAAKALTKAMDEAHEREDAAKARVAELETALNNALHGWEVGVDIAGPMHELRRLKL